MQPLPFLRECKTFRVNWISRTCALFLIQMWEYIKADVRFLHEHVIVLTQSQQIYGYSVYSHFNLVKVTRVLVVIVPISTKVFILKDWWEVGVTVQKWAKTGLFCAEWAVQALIINRWVLRVSQKKWFPTKYGRFLIIFSKSFFDTMTPTSINLLE